MIFGGSAGSEFAGALAFVVAQSANALAAVIADNQLGFATNAVSVEALGQKSL
jgi:hypothetical protein